MARNDEQRNINIHFDTNAQQAATEVDNLTRSVNQATQATDRQATSVSKVTDEITSNGGAMAILDTVTGGWASTVKDSIEALGLFTKGTNLSTVAQRAYTMVVGTSTGALKAFRIALAATGIGAAVVLIGFLVEAWMNLANATDEATEAQKRFDAQAKISKQVADERMSDLEFEAEMLREIARERGASIQETRRLETEAYNKRLDELRRQSLDEKLSVEDRREAAKKWSQEFNQNLLREQRWRADDAESARETARATAQNRVKIAKDNSAELKRIEEERIAFYKKVETDYKDWLSVNQAVNPSKGLLAQGEINYRKLQEQRAADLKDAERYVKNNNEHYTELTNTINTYYDVQLARLKAEKEEILGIEAAAFELGVSNIDVRNEYDINAVSQVYKQTLDFIEGIKNSDLKAYYSEVFNIDRIKQSQALIEKYKVSVNELVELKPENGTIFANSLFGSESDAVTSINKLKEYNNLVLIAQEEQAISEAELLEASEAEKQLIRDRYHKLRQDNEQASADAIVEITKLQQQQQMQALNAYGDLLGATAGLMEEHTTGYKVLAIAQTTIDTYTSAMSAYKGMVQAIPGPVGIAAGAAAAAASVITGISNVKKILAVKVPGGSSSSAGAAPSATATNVHFVSSSENQIATSVANATNNQNNKPIKAYVVSSDVSTAQSLEMNKIESNSL